MTKVALNCSAQEDEASGTRPLAAGVRVAGQEAQARESRTAVPPQEAKWDVSSLPCMVQDGMCILQAAENIVLCLHLGPFSGPPSILCLS